MSFLTPDKTIVTQIREICKYILLVFSETVLWIQASVFPIPRFRLSWRTCASNPSSPGT